MSIQAVLLPVFVLIALTFFLTVRMGQARVGSLKKGELKIRDIALGQNAWSDPVKQVSNAFHNQLELPILFYALVAFALITQKADLIFVVMSWIFVVLRVAHAFIHITSNRVTQRFFFFMLGMVVLMLMWLIFAVRILIA